MAPKSATTTNAHLNVGTHTQFWEYDFFDGFVNAPGDFWEVQLTSINAIRLAQCTQMA